MSFDSRVSDLMKNTISTHNLMKYSIRDNAAALDIFRFCVAMQLCWEKLIKGESDLSDPSSCYSVSKIAVGGYLHMYSKIPSHQSPPAS